MDKGEPVFINFTAKWCITCLANERLAFSSKEFSDLISLRKIHIFKADWTNESEEITKALAAYGRNSIPLYVYYDGKSRQYVILPQLLTDSILKGYLVLAEYGILNEIEGKRMNLKEKEAEKNTEK